MNTEALARLGACQDAIDWAAAQSNAKTAWCECKRGDWMLWLLGKLSGGPKTKSRKRLVLAACACARLSLRYVPKGEKRQRLAIETAEKWARGANGVTIAMVRNAAAAAYAYAAANAANAAAYAADNAANAAAYANARAKVLAKCADIVRKHYPKPPALDAKGEGR